MPLLHWPRDTKVYTTAPATDLCPPCDPIPSLYHYQPGADEADRDVTLTASISEHPDGNTEVLRARSRLCTSPTSFSPEQDVVCKVAYGMRRVRSLKKEAEMYERLLAFQGMGLPVIYSFYAGETPEEGQIAVLVMEDCGKALTAPLKCYSVDVRYECIGLFPQ